VDLMRSMTQREYKARIAWLKAELGEGTRAVTRKKEPSSREEAAAWARAKWFGAMGIKGDS
jgi:hypothetical protein